MTRYSKEFREQALKLSDEIGVKKASEQLGVLYDTLAD
jgi:transposase